MVFLTLTYLMSTGSGSSYSNSYTSPVKIPDDRARDKAHGSSGGTTTTTTSAAAASTNTVLSAGTSDPAPGLSDAILKGGSIAPKLENATAKFAPSPPNPVSPNP